MPQYHLYAFLLGLSALLSTTICIISWNRRSAPGAVPLIYLTAGLMWWSFSYALHWFAVAQAREVFWLDATYAGVVVVPTAFLAFGMVFTQKIPRLSTRVRWLLAIEPLLTVLILWTDPFHGLFFGGTRSVEPGAILSGGVWFWVNVAYSYLLIGAAIFILAREFVRGPRFQRNQVATVVAGAAIPIFSNVIGLLRISPFPNLDLTPMAFTLTSILFAAGLYMFRMLDIVPIARSLVIESMYDGVLVLDARNRIVDINQQACRLMGIPDLEPIGQPAERIISNWQSISYRYDENIQYRDILTTDDYPKRRIEVHITPIINKDRNTLGRLAILRDITDKVQTEESLLKMNTDLQKKIEEIESLQAVLREQAVRDPLTGLYNRRFMEEFLEQELAKAERTHRPIGLIYLDVDHFKQINDRFGHQGGDLVLQGLGELLHGLAMKGDLTCRVGGDEFVVVIPGTTLEDAQTRAEHLRLEFYRQSQSFLAELTDATLSLGISAFPCHGRHSDDLLRAADQAMYAAKANGRNQSAVYQN